MKGKPYHKKDDRSYFAIHTALYFPPHSLYFVLEQTQDERVEDRKYLREGMAMFVAIPNFGEGNGTPLHYSCLENPMDGGAWWAAVHGVAKSRTRLSDFTFTFHFHALEKEMATHSSALAWRIPGTGEPGGLLSMGSHRVGHD